MKVKEYITKLNDQKHTYLAEVRGASLFLPG